MRSWFRLAVWGFGSFAVGFGAQLRWAESSQWMWWSLAAVAVLVGLVERRWDETLVPWWRATYQEKLRTAWHWVFKHRYAILIVIPLLAMVATDGRVVGVVTSVVTSVQTRPNHYADLPTRPICEVDCANVDFRIRECEVMAAEVGGLGYRRRTTPQRSRAATEYFRGCLIDRGLTWEPCDRGQPGCRLLRGWGNNRRVPSFRY